jgi:hypothetical protein
MNQMNSILNNIVKRGHLGLLVWSVISLLGLGSCIEKDAKIPPPEYSKRTAIICYLSPRNPDVSVQLGFTVPYFGVQSDTISYYSDAKVTVSDLTVGTSVVLPFNKVDFVYRVGKNKMPIINDHQYRVDVVLADGRSYTATTQIPPKLGPTDLKLGKYSVGKLEQNQQFDQQVSVNVELKTGNTQKGFYYSPQFDVVLEDGNGNFYGNTMIFKGTGIEEGLGADTLRFIYQDRMWLQGGGGMGGSNAIDPMKLNGAEGTFWVFDKGYTESYNKFFEDTGNPFAEPILLYSNWSNGAVGTLGSFDWEEMTITP